jgi:hypothetical protein
MDAPGPDISWKIFFERLTPEGQRCLESALVDGGILLGEYMEIVERAYYEAFLLQQSTKPSFGADLRMNAEAIAADRVRSYASRKRQFVRERARSAQAAFGQSAHALTGGVVEGVPAGTAGRPSLLSSFGRLQRRRQIHQRIEAMKRAQG